VLAPEHVGKAGLLQPKMGIPCLGCFMDLKTIKKDQPFLRIIISQDGLKLMVTYLQHLLPILDLMKPGALFKT
jgi:hypothetical protein